MNPEDYFTKDLDKPIKMGEMEVIPVWFDSIGAKSMCTFVKTPDVNILIDPGFAIMQPSYPLSDIEKNAFQKAAEERVREYSKISDVVIITHYHYDHHKRPLELPESYINKELFIKDPNKWINYSQWKRARLLYEDLLIILNTNLDLKDLEKEPEEIDFKDPYEDLKILQKKDFGDYTIRHKELLEQWKSNMLRISKIWRKEKWIDEFSVGETKVHFISKGTINFGRTKISFQRSFFHGIEYAKTGWVEPIVIEYKSSKLIFSSDLQGPTIEDYAEWIIKEEPNVIILDGPATYLFGYMLNRTNLNRSIENASRIVRESDFDLMIYDHHCLREKKFRDRLSPFYNIVKESGKNVITAAEWVGLRPLVDLI